MAREISVTNKSLIRKINNRNNDIDLETKEYLDNKDGTDKNLAKHFYEIKLKSILNIESVYQQNSQVELSLQVEDNANEKSNKVQNIVNLYFTDENYEPGCIASGLRGS